MLELVGGLLIVAGLATRLVSLLFIVELLVAVIRYKYGENVGYIGTGEAGAELDWVLIAGFVAVAVQGPGPYSIDHRLGLERAAPPAVSATAGRRWPSNGRFGDRPLSVPVE